MRNEKQNPKPLLVQKKENKLKEKNRKRKPNKKHKHNMAEIRKNIHTHDKCKRYFLFI